MAKKNIVFKIDDAEYHSVGQDVRVEVELGMGRSLTAILTHEGLVVDCFTNGNPTGTFASLYDALFEDHFDNNADVYAHLTEDQHEKMKELCIEKAMKEGLSRERASKIYRHAGVTDFLGHLGYFEDRATIAEKLSFYVETGTEEEPAD